MCQSGLTLAGKFTQVYCFHCFRATLISKPNPLPLMYSTAILNQVNLFLRALMRILRFLRTLKRILRKKRETVVPPILLTIN